MANLEAPGVNSHSQLSSSEHTLTDIPAFRPNMEKPNHSLQFVETAVNPGYSKELESAPLMINPEPVAAPSRWGNPAIVGNWAFGTIYLFMGLYKLILPTSSGHMMLPVALVFAGFAQFLAGLLCLFQGNTWGGSVFMSWGACWFGNGFMMIPGVGSTLDVYNTHETNIANGLLNFVWAAYAIMIVIMSTRLQGGHLLGTGNLFWIFMNCLFEGIFDITGAPGAMRASGAFSLCGSIGAFYAAAVDIFGEQGIALWVGPYKRHNN